MKKGVVVFLMSFISFLSCNGSHEKIITVKNNHTSAVEAALRYHFDASPVIFCQTNFIKPQQVVRFKITDPEKLTYIWLSAWRQHRSGKIEIQDLLTHNKDAFEIVTHAQNARIFIIQALQAKL